MNINFRDLIERIIWTAVQSAGGTLVAASTIDGIEAWHAAAVSAIAAAITVLTTFARRRLGKLEG
jgi:hypothetical protein